MFGAYTLTSYTGSCPGLPTQTMASLVAAADTVPVVGWTAPVVSIDFVASADVVPVAD